jgi:PDZ domain-containing protein
LPVPFVVLSPGPTFNTIGDVDGVPVVEITDTTTYPVTGALDMTTIREEGEPRSPLTVFGALAAWIDPNRAVLPRELLYGDDETTEEVEQRNAVLFSTSQSNAIAAAMGAVGKPVFEDVVITAVVEGTPAFGVLEAGERIIAIDGGDVRAPEDVVAAVRAKPVGSTLVFTVEREGQAVDVDVVSAPKPDEADVPYVGITVGINYRAEFPISFTLEDIGGPSAGMMFSLAIVDKLTPEDLTDGGHVAGTGTIDPQGAVGAIGGIRQKLAGARAAGATLFLMPDVHCEEASGHIPDGLTVVPVATLQDSLDALTAWRAGDALPTCPAA